MTSWGWQNSHEVGTKEKPWAQGHTFVPATRNVAGVTDYVVLNRFHIAATVIRIFEVGSCRFAGITRIWHGSNA
jgi:hypothetical protein